MSGYSARERRDTIKGAIERLRQMKNKIETGEIAMLNRSREEILMDKARKGGNACTWFTGVPVESESGLLTMLSQILNLITFLPHEGKKVWHVIPF
jgi:hypothetical protein